MAPDSRDVHEDQRARNQKLFGQPARPGGVVTDWEGRRVLTAAEAAALGRPWSDPTSNPMADMKRMAGYKTPDEVAEGEPLPPEWQG